MYIVSLLCTIVYSFKDLSIEKLQARNLYVSQDLRLDPIDCMSKYLVIDSPLDNIVGN